MVVSVNRSFMHFVFVRQRIPTNTKCKKHRNTDTTR